MLFFWNNTSFIAGISKAEKSKAFFCLKGNYNIPTSVFKLRQTVKMLNFSLSDNLEKNKIRECITFALDNSIYVCSGLGGHAS